jgi:hypothetical protein
MCAHKPISSRETAPRRRPSFARFWIIAAGIRSSPLYALAQLGFGRASALNSDNSASRKAYQDFFDAWKDADASIPILSEARREYEKLK